jgi:putative membrane protein (TIGR04086 family)
MSDLRMRWGRIVAAGLVAEVALILAIVPAGMRLGEAFLHYTAGPGSFITCFLAALWVGRGVRSRFVLHGVLVGVVAAIIYIVLTRAQPEPMAYIIAHVLKLAGGACGGIIAQRRHGAAVSKSQAAPSA